MSKIFLIALLAVAACLEIVHSQRSTKPTLKPQSCPTSCGPFECGPLGEKVWSVVDGVCKHWENRCKFDRENCSRENQCEDKLVETTQKECIKNCPDVCLTSISPVCASFLVRGEQGEATIKKQTFNSSCELDRYICQNGIALGDSTKDGACEE